MAAAASAPNVAAEVEPVYRHYRKDFGPLQTRPLHLDLSFDLSEARVVVEARTTFLHVGAEALATLTLNSKDLDIQAVELLSGGGAGITTLAEKPSSEEFVAHVASLAGATATPLKFEVDSKDHLLRVHLPSAVTKGTQFVLRTKSVATPTAHILEGLYFDWTPYVIFAFYKCNTRAAAGPACCASERDRQSSVFFSLLVHLCCVAACCQGGTAKDDHHVSFSNHMLLHPSQRLLQLRTLVPKGLATLIARKAHCSCVVIVVRCS
jgi:hypothetical protein